MTDTDVEFALQARLAQITVDFPELTIVYENKISNPPRPYLYVEHVPTGQTDPTLTGGHKTSAGFMAVSIVIGQDQFVTDARRITDAIEALFPYPTLISLTDGKVTIDRPVRRIKGYQSGMDYLMPLNIYYQAN